MGGMSEQKIAQDTEAEAQAFIAENEPLLERAAPATLHRIILHGSEIASRLSDEVVAEMKDKADSLNVLADAINDSATPLAHIQRLEEKRMRVQAHESTKQQTFEALSGVIQRAITLRQEREVPDGSKLVFSTFNPGPVEVPVAPARQQPKRGFWRRLFGRE